ncbi:trichohyalin-like [Pygocentrus nattereri]|uniref:trichohyalin-like n=1 Tax=Pygocentrus nattereri TaxID=42514 RepID=UPI001891824B|nr:trichohyalin-like [Pygocentrus nattereri]
MSCLLFWCCRGRQSDSDGETNANEEQLRRDGVQIKKKKKWRARKRKRQQEKEPAVDVGRAEELQVAPQPAAGEEGSDGPHLPAGTVCGSLERISAGSVEKMEPPLLEDFHSTKAIPGASNDPAGNLLDQIEAEAEAEAIKALMSTDLDEEADNNQPLENQTTSSEAEAIEQLMEALLQEVEAHSAALTETEELMNDVPANEVKAEEQERNISSETCETTEADKEDLSTRISGDRGIQVGGVDQSRHQQAFGEKRTLSENSGPCERAPETDPQEQRRAQRKEGRRESCHWTVKHALKTLQAPPEEKSAPQREYRTQPENPRSCVRAPNTDPQQQRRAQRKEGRRESCHWTVKHALKTLQAPPEEKSAPQREYRTQTENPRSCVRAPNTDPQQQRRTQRKEDRGEVRHWTFKYALKTLQAPPVSAPQTDSRECLRVRTADIRQKTHPTPPNKPRDRGCRKGEYGRGAAQGWQSESCCQRRDAPRTPSNNGGRVSERGKRGNPAQCTPARTERNQRTVREPNWQQHEDRSAEPEERETRDRGQKKKWSNGNRQWRSGRRPDASH